MRAFFYVRVFMRGERKPPPMARAESSARQHQGIELGSDRGIAGLIGSIEDDLGGGDLVEVHPVAERSAPFVAAVPIGFARDRVPQHLDQTPALVEDADFVR